VLKTIRPKVWDRTLRIGMGQLVSHQPSPCQKLADGGKTAQITGRAKSLGSGALSVARLMRAAVGGKKFLLKVSRELSGVVTHLGGKPSSRPTRSAILRKMTPQRSMNKVAFGHLSRRWRSGSPTAAVDGVPFLCMGGQVPPICKGCNLSTLIGPIRCTLKQFDGCGWSLPPSFSYLLMAVAGHCHQFSASLLMAVAGHCHQVSASSLIMAVAGHCHQVSASSLMAVAGHCHQSSASSLMAVAGHCHQVSASSLTMAVGGHCNQVSASSLMAVAGHCHQVSASSLLFDGSGWSLPPSFS
jgi:hypothetical protein